MMMTDAPEQPKPKRLPRFSLRSLVLAVLLAGSGYGLWAGWEPWQRMAPIPGRFYGFSTDSSIYVAAERDDASDTWTVRLRDAETRRMIAQIAEPPERITGATCSAGGNRTLITSEDRRIHVYDAAGTRILTFDDHLKESQPDAPMSVIPIAGGDLAVSWEREVVRVWDTRSGDVKLAVGAVGQIKVDEISIDQIAASSDGAHFAVSVADGTLQAWQTATQKRLPLKMPPDWDGSPWDIYVTRDTVLGVNPRDYFGIWDFLAGRKAAGLPISMPHAGVTFSDDAKLVAFSPAEHPLCIWDTRTRRLEFDDPSAIEDSIVMRFAPDSRRLLTVGLDGVFRVRDASRMRMLYSHEFGAGDVRTKVWVSGDGSQVVYYTGSWMGEYLHLRRRRPEYWWGVAWLPVFWAVVVLGGGLVWSVWWDRRALHGDAAAG